MTVFRFAVPAVLVVAGAICLIIGGDVLTPIGIGVAGAAAVVAMSTVFLRIGLAEERDRAQEDAAREHYARTGRWPDEEPPAQEPAAPPAALGTSRVHRVVLRACASSSPRSSCSFSPPHPPAATACPSSASTPDRPA